MSTSAKMDNQITSARRKGDVMFEVIKNIIVYENKELFKIICKKYPRLRYEELEEKYIRPEYYLPLVKCTK